MNAKQVTAIKLKQNVEVICKFADRMTYSYVFDARQAKEGAKVMSVAVGPVVKTQRTVKPVTHVFERDEEFGTGVVYPV